MRKSLVLILTIFAIIGIMSLGLIFLTLLGLALTHDQSDFISFSKFVWGNKELIVACLSGLIPLLFPKIRNEIDSHPIGDYLLKNIG